MTRCCSITLPTTCTGRWSGSTPTVQVVPDPVAPEEPDEEDELLHESLMSARNAVRNLDNQASTPSWNSSSTGLQPTTNTQQFHQMYLTPSPSANRNSIHYGHTDYVPHSKPMDINKPRQPADTLQPKWPTPPYEDSEWASSAAASILAAQTVYR